MKRKRKEWLGDGRKGRKEPKKALKLHNLQAKPSLSPSPPFLKSKDSNPTSISLSLLTKIIESEQCAYISTMSIRSSSSSAKYRNTVKLFGRQRSLHAVLGGGRVANLLLWRNKAVTGGILAGITSIWWLFEVVEYNFLSFLCQISITGMLLMFILSNGAMLANRVPPNILEFFPESHMKRAAHILHAELMQFLSFLQHISSGKDIKLFLKAITILWIISVVGSSFSSLNIIYLGLVLLFTIPALYEQYEEEVDSIATKRSEDINRLYRGLYYKHLKKIPRGLSKDKRFTENDKAVKENTHK